MLQTDRVNSVCERLDMCGEGAAFLRSAPRMAARSAASALASAVLDDFGRPDLRTEKLSLGVLGILGLVLDVDSALRFPAALDDGAGSAARTSSTLVRVGLASSSSERAMAAAVSAADDRLGRDLERGSIRKREESGSFAISEGDRLEFMAESYRSQ